MKARKVKGLDPAGTLADNAERIVAVRLDELCSFVPRALDPEQVEALHDMRIAAKRLRYVLEVTGSCFGPYAMQALKRAKELQDLLGEIHDCDVLVPRLLSLMGEVRDAEGDHDALQGLDALVVRHRARRELLFSRFLSYWTKLERDGFRARLEYAITERPLGATLAET